MPDASRVTVKDLRVKLCYICREEEPFDKPEDPPRAWVHPCNCTLIAHESCLLQWIQTSQASRTRAPNALKCPQCGTAYELESSNPYVLKLLDAGNLGLSLAGRMFTVLTLSSAIAAVGTGIYVVSTAYGAYALQEFLGKEMYDLIVTDDPSNWPWHTFINLPLIPLSLIARRFGYRTALEPAWTLLLVWSSSGPVQRGDAFNQAPWTPLDITRPLPESPSPFSWPPSPAICALMLPFIRGFYRKQFTRFSHYVLDTRPEPRLPGRAPMWAMNEGGLRIRFVLGDVDPDEAAAAAGVNGGAAGQGQQADAAPDGAIAAQQTITATGSSLGRAFGGALIVPAIANLMGSLLFRLACRSPLLKKLLAIRPPLTSRPMTPGIAIPGSWHSMSTIRRIGVASKIVATGMWSGSALWRECDPVWWRNSIGLGIFVVAKDCIHLLHLWLTKRELETRKVVNKSFEGVDVRELDLIDSPRRA